MGLHAGDLKHQSKSLPCVARIHLVSDVTARLQGLFQSAHVVIHPEQESKGVHGQLASIDPNFDVFAVESLGVWNRWAHVMGPFGWPLCFVDLR